ncbi:MAG: hypothetical protein KAG28_08355 [Cocleimonas sp.]|nr:hypothetical protein [Cocleimonas sp.]
MRLSRHQLEEFHLNMLEAAENTRENEDAAKQSIRRTNTVIYVFTALGAILAALILYYFLLLNQAISHSIDSMKEINQQVTELRGTMDNVTASIKTMGNNVAFLQNIGDSVGNISQSTQIVDRFMDVLKQETNHLSTHASNIRLHTSNINQNFSQINQSVNNISFSVHQAVKPIKQFLPMP